MTAAYLSASALARWAAATRLFSTLKTQLRDSPGIALPICFVWLDVGPFLTNGSLPLRSRSTKDSASTERLDQP